MSSLAEWRRYFESIAEFLQGASRQFGVANGSFTEYVIERLDLCISTCTTLKEQLTVSTSTHRERNTQDDLQDSEEEVVLRYRSELEGLVDSLMAIQLQWKEYREVLEARVEEVSFEVGTIQTHSRGRPCFNVSKEQLEYLSSLGFSWTEVSTLLGVSRMTIYR